MAKEDPVTIEGLVKGVDFNTCENPQGATSRCNIHVLVESYDGSLFTVYNHSVQTETVSPLLSRLRDAIKASERVRVTDVETDKILGLYEAVSPYRIISKDTKPA